jgi:hypothetical protein
MSAEGCPGATRSDITAGFYLEPVDLGTGTVDDAVREHVVR